MYKRQAAQVEKLCVTIDKTAGAMEALRRALHALDLSLIHISCGIWMEIFMIPVTGAILLQLLLFSLILPVGTVLSNITIIQCRRGRST